MKFVDRATFMAMPEGTIFSKVPALPTYDFGELEIKRETVGSDFYSQQLIGSIKDSTDSDQWFEAIDALHAGEQRACDFEVIGRDGLFDQEQTFAVLERQDVDGLIALLSECREIGYPPA